MEYKPYQNIPHSCERKKKLYTERKILAIEVTSLLEENTLWPESQQISGYRN